MDTLERYYIYKETKSNNQMKDKLTVKPNAVVEILIHEGPSDDTRTHSNQTAKA